MVTFQHRLHSSERSERILWETQLALVIEPYCRIQSHWCWHISCDRLKLEVTPLVLVIRQQEIVLCLASVVTLPFNSP